VEVSAVIDVADENGSVGKAGFLDLGVAAQAKIRITDGQKFRVHRTVRGMTGCAPFAERGMFEDVWLGLFAVAIGTCFIHSRHREAAVRFHDVCAVRVVALDAVHFAFKDRVMLRQMKLSIRGDVTLKTGFGLFSGIDDEFATADGDVFASGTVAGFASLLAGHLRIGHTDARVWTGWKDAGDLVVAIGAGLVADVGRTFDLLWDDDGAAVETGAGVDEYNRSRCKDQQEQGNDDAFHQNWALSVWLTRNAVESVWRRNGVAEQRRINGSGVSRV
jgi:hypothetical protein